MKKLLLPLIIMLLVLAACGNQGEKNNNAETKSYKMDDGKTVDIPKDPKRIAVVAPTYAGGLKNRCKHCSCKSTSRSKQSIKR